MLKCVTTVLVLLSTAAAAQTLPNLPAAVLPPELAWSGVSERLIALATEPWITPVEAAGFATTPDCAATRAWLERLAAASPLVETETFGPSVEGRDLLLVRASTGPASDGMAKPVVQVKGGIPAGEIDGKDAGLMLLRDIALRGKEALLDDVDLAFVPILNTDGHEFRSRWNFPTHRGPDEQGQAYERASAFYT